MTLFDIAVWVACASAYLAVLRLLARDPAGITGMAIAALQAILVGLAWSGILLAPARWWPGSTKLSPGHWLLIALGLRLATEMLLRFSPPRLFSSPGTVVEAITCWVLVLPLLNRRLVLRWKLALLLVLFLYTAPLVALCLYVFGDLLSQGQVTGLRLAVDWLQGTVVPALLLGTLFWEARRDPASDWLHPAGIAAWCVAAVHWLVVQA